ncbi:MAG: M24 family metallopeptidase [Erysipelotrichia bacterium]|nr:M24 family metallopeptidase [Erysipelotrichia bacterium]
MYKKRREQLLTMLDQYSITVLMAGKAPYSIGDAKYPFEVNRSFYYYTGLDKENLVLVLVKLDENTTKEILFIESYDEVLAKWVGGRIRPNQAKEISGIEDVRYLDTLLQSIGTYLNYNGKVIDFILCGDLTKQELEQPNATVDLFNKIKKLQPQVEFTNIYDKICSMRAIKDNHEIELIKKAIDVTQEGIETMMRYSHANVWENELEAYFDFVLKCKNCKHAFNTICATGKNATILHYVENNDYAKTDDLVLCDLGASYQYYNADITRTFPVNGKFTNRQKEIYDIVLRANKLVESLARPKVTTKELNEEVIKFYEVELAAIGLLENGKTVKDFYYHGVSHMLGLETHDVALVDMPLKPGCVITNEPGLYLEDEDIGIRIEDDLLITEDGCINLSKNIIKEIEEIEAFMVKN